MPVLFTGTRCELPILWNEGVLVFTDGDFCELMKRRGERHGIGQIRLLVCPLRAGLRSAVKEVLNAASQEQRAADG